MIHTMLTIKEKKLTTHCTYYSDMFAEKKFGTLDLKSLKDVMNLSSLVSPFHIVAQ